MRKRPLNQPIEGQNPIAGSESLIIERPNKKNAGFECKEKYYHELVVNCFDGVWLVKFDPPIDSHLPLTNLVEAMLEGAYIVEASDSLAQTYGLQSSNQIVGHYFKEWFPPTQKNLDILRSFAQNNFCWYNVLSGEKDKKGNTLYLENSAVGILEDQYLVGIWGVQRDVTARKKMEETREYALRIEQTLGKISSFFLTIEDLDQCINATLREAGMLLQASRAYLFQASEDYQKANNTHEWVAPGVTPQIDKMQGLEASSFPWWLEQLTQNKVIAVSDVDQIPDPERALLQSQDVVSVLVIPFHMGGRLAGFFGFDETKKKREWLPEELTLLRTVSEILSRALEWEKSHQTLKESEEKFRLFQSSVCDVIYRYDPINDRYDFISPSVELQTGYSVEDFSHHAKQKYESIINPEDWKQIQGEIEKQIAIGPPGKPFQVEFRITRKDGTEIWVCDQNTLEFSEDGRVKRINGVTRDITESKQVGKKLERYAQDLKEKNRELEAKNRELFATRAQLAQREKLRALGQMASGLAHDFNNFLAIILGRAQLLRKKADNLEMERGLSIIEKAAQDASSTVKRIQDFARIRKDKEFRWVDLDDLIEDVIAATKIEWKDQAEARGVTIKLRVERDRRKLPPFTGDESELREVLTNLILNAVEAMPKGGEIVVKTSTDRRSVFISVADTGVGMPDEVKRKIFDPFFTTKAVNNTGLGLSVAYGIIQRHGGDIWAESNPDKGTTMVLRLPVRNELKHLTTEKQNWKPSPSARFSANILVIEDDEDIRPLLFDILTSASYRVVVSPNGQKGVETFQKNKFDLVITALGMPEMPGWEVTEKIKKIDPNIPVLLLSGWGMELDQERLNKSRIDQVIPKPIQVDNLLKIVAGTLESKKKKSELAEELV